MQILVNHCKSSIIKNHVYFEQRYDETFYLSILISKVTNANTIFVAITGVLQKPYYYFIVMYKQTRAFATFLEDLFAFIYEGLYSTILVIVL